MMGDTKVKLNKGSTRCITSDSIKFLGQASRQAASEKTNIQSSETNQIETGKGRIQGMDLQELPGTILVLSPHG